MNDRYFKSGLKYKAMNFILTRVLKMHCYRIDSADGSYCHVWSGGPVIGGNPTQVTR